MRFRPQVGIDLSQARAAEPQGEPPLPSYYPTHAAAWASYLPFPIYHPTQAGRGGENERFVRDEAERVFKLCDVSSDGELNLDV